MKVGDPVKFKADGGSIGEVIAILDTGRLDVRWYYGTDVKEEEVTSVSRHVPDWQLVPIEPTALATHRRRRFNSGKCACGACQ